MVMLRCLAFIAVLMAVTYGQTDQPCRMLFGDDCDTSRCEKTAEGFCSPIDTGGDCDTLTDDECPNRCTIGSNGCRDKTCQDVFDPTECRDSTTLSCSWNDDLASCFDEGSAPPCDRYFDETLCSTQSDRCEWDGDDANYCKDKGSTTPCDKYFEVDTCLKRSDRCTFYNTSGICFDKNEPLPCQYFQFDGCVDNQDRCCYDVANRNCEELASGQTCDLDIKPCNEYDSAETCIPTCTFDSDTNQCRDQSCREIFNSGDCQANSECEFYSPQCFPKDNGKACSEQTLSTCHAACDIQEGECVDASCFSVFDQGRCELLDGCSYSNGFCSDGGSGDTCSSLSSSECSNNLDCQVCEGFCVSISDFCSSTQTPTSGGPCSSRDQNSCFGLCIFDFDNNVCKNATCREVFDQNLCTQLDCVVIESTGTCSPRDTGEACDSYDADTCPLQRCTAKADETNFESIICAEKVCDDIFDSIECANSELGCYFVEAAFRCLKNGTEPPCDLFYTENECPAGCTWFQQLSICRSGQPNCRDYGFNIACPEDRCRKIDLTGECIEQDDKITCTNQPESTCRLLSDCQWDDGSSSCGDCASGSCVQSCPSNSDCSSLDLDTCNNRGDCVADETDTCKQQFCTSMFDPCDCQSNSACEYVGGICALKDPGTPCDEITDDRVCDALRRCQSTGDLESVCRDSECGDSFDSSSCASIPGCVWNLQNNICHAPGDDICPRIFSSTDCQLTTGCVYDNELSICRNASAPIACDARSKREICLDGGDCDWLPLAQSCVDDASALSCSDFGNPPSCENQDGCFWSSQMFRCMEDGETIDCAFNYNSVICSFQAGCKYVESTFTCTDCEVGSECQGQTSLPDCASFDPFNCPSEYCSFGDDGCEQATCEDIQQIELCRIADGCEYNVFTDSCQEEGKVTDCYDFPDQSFCDDTRCEWNEEYAFCNVKGDELPCQAYRNETVCESFVGVCMWQFGMCEIFTTTTTSTTTTSTTPNNPCNNFGTCDSNTECIFDLMGDYECTPCPEGMVGESDLARGGGGCSPVSCPSQIPDLESKNATAYPCSRSYNSTCTVRCEDGFEKVSGDFEFRCGGEEEWIGDIACQDIPECEVANPCSNYTTCSEPEPNDVQCTPCPDGFIDVKGDGTECRDILECEKRSSCHFTQTCIEEIGGYRCTECGDGWRPVGDNDCEDIPECSEGTPCHPESRCSEKDGGYECLKCNFGWDGDGYGPEGCQRKSCPEDPTTNFEGATADCADNHFYQDTCTVSCGVGYSGSDTEFTCLASGIWSGYIFCTPATCSSAPSINIPNIDTSALNRCGGDRECSLKCAAGYLTSHPEAKLECIANNQWSAPPEGFSCVQCPAGQFVNNDGECQTFSPACSGATPVQAQPPSKTSDRVCRGYTQCDDDEYEFRAPQGSIDRACRECKSCQSQVEIGFRSKDCTDTTDAECTPCSTCSTYQYVQSSCTETSDTVCGECPYGQFALPNTDNCQKWRVCPIGSAEIQAPTGSSDRRCDLTPSEVGERAPAGRVYVEGSMDVDSPGFSENEDARNAFSRGIDSLFEFPTSTTILKVEESGNSRRRNVNTVTYRVEAERVHRNADFENTLGNDEAVLAAITAESQRLGVAPPSSVTAQSFTIDPPPVTTTTTAQSTVDGSGSDDDNMIIIIAAAAGGAVVLIILIIVIVCCCCRKSEGSSISGPVSAKDENVYLYENINSTFEVIGSKALESSSAAPQATRSTRQSSFYSSIKKAQSEA